MSKQKGYTVTELIFGVAFLGMLVLLGFCVYAIVHFVSKFW